MSSNINERIKKYSLDNVEVIMSDYSYSGLTKNQVIQSLKEYGNNNVSDVDKISIYKILKSSFINPYSIVLLILDIISLFTDIIFSEKRNITTCIIITTMLLISGIIRLIQELKSKKITDNLKDIVDTETTVKRDNEYVKISNNSIVVGDYIKLFPGDKVPADIRIIKCNDLFVSESLITGESKIEDKNNLPLKSKPNKINDYKNTLFKGSTIIGGFAEGVVLAVGKDTIYGTFSPINKKHKKDFDKGSNSIVWVLIKFMTILIPIVFVASGLTKGNWLNSFLFALSVAVGLTPEMLPMVISACLAKGSSNMSNKQVIVKNINAMQTLGNMDILCVDKTGTLTQDSLILEYYMDILGNESNTTLNYAYLNSYYSNGIKNQLDNAILSIKNIPNKSSYYENLIQKYNKIDEMPFDYNRKISSVLLKQSKNSNLLICKGPVNEIIKRCNKVKYKDKTINIDNNDTMSVNNVVDDMLEDGVKVLAIAVKSINSNSIENLEENNLTLIGYLGFFDAPKQSSFSAIQKLNNLNVNIKVLTGDNKKIAVSICNRLNIDSKNSITGDEFDQLNDDLKIFTVENTTVFSELTPKQKSNIINLLQNNKHTVGFLGDGMNDLHAMTNADVAISVENASSTIKDIADVILLKKDLNVLEEGIVEGRKSFKNMSKYTKITASSNLGNILAVVIASIFLPFFPMTSIQLLLLNLLYDILCLILPWDNVDKEMIEKPSDWSSNKLSTFMLTFGPISSIFDVITFIFLFFYLCPSICGAPFNSLELIEQQRFISIFQTGWFLESMWTQILIIHLLRTKKLPFVNSTPAIPVTLITIFGIILFTLLTLTPIGTARGLTSLPIIYYLFLIGVVILYLLSVTIIKRFYLKKNDNLI